MDEKFIWTGILCFFWLALGIGVGGLIEKGREQSRQETQKIEQVEKDLKETREALQNISLYLQTRGTH